MSAILIAWLTVTLALSILAWAAIWARGLSRARGLAVAAFLVSLPLSALALSSGLGWPIPYLPGITISAGKHQVLGVKIEEGVAIYVLFDGAIPRFYRLPWSTETAQSVQDAMEQGKDGVAANVMPFDFSLDRREPIFYPLPQQPLPPKQVPATQIGPEAPQ